MSFKTKLKSGAPRLGTWCVLPSPEVTDVIAASGVDFVIVDLEHGPADFVTAGRMVRAARGRGAAALIRVGADSELDILRALDSGADGVIVPHIETVEARRRAMSYIQYPPKGKRGFSPYTPAAEYGTASGYTEAANNRTIAGIIVEGEAGIAEIDDIADDPNLDLVYIGTYDISASLGIPGKTRDDRVLAVLEACAAKVAAKNKIVGCLYHDARERELFIKLGITFLCYSVDAAVIKDAFCGQVAACRSRARGGNT